jgi:hypothetical protein
MHGLIFCRKHDLLIPCIRPVVPCVLLNPFLGVESQLGAAGITFQGPAFAKSGRLRSSGDIHRAAKNFHAKAVLFQVRAEFALAIRRHRGVSDLDVINVTGIGLKNNDVLSPPLTYRGGGVVLGQKVESGIALLERHAIQLVAIGVQRQLMEKQSGELADAGGGTVFKFHFGITAGGTIRAVINTCEYL